jgi:uncharacterized membrane protein YraQ (UPF0718 family)
MLYEMAPYTLAGMLAAGVVHELLGKFKQFSSFARKRNIVSLSVFNFAGLTLPVCSCGVVPLAVGMKKQGVPLGNIFCFLFSAPATSVTAIILSLAMLGTTFTLYYVCGALVCGYVIGFLFYNLEKRHRFQNPPSMTTYDCHESDSQEETAKLGF